MTELKIQGGDVLPKIGYSTLGGDVLPKIGYSTLGGDASDHAISVYGDMGQQRAMVDPTGNANNVIAHNMPKSIGGRRTRMRKNIIIPTVLLVANTNCKKTKRRKTKKGGKSRKMRKGGKSRRSKK
jgi:hypothetical protein